VLYIRFLPFLCIPFVGILAVLVGQMDIDLDSRHDAGVP
jgi:hypothetical protein